MQTLQPAMRTNQDLPKKVKNFSRNIEKPRSLNKRNLSIATLLRFKKINLDSQAIRTH